MLNINMKNILNKNIFLCFLLYSMFFYLMRVLDIFLLE